MARLKKGDISLREVYQISRDVYYKKVDSKSKRKIDITSAKLRLRRNLSFDSKTKTWVQTGREVRFDFLVQSDPVSYRRPAWDTKKHLYPVTFLIRDFESGLESAFRFRTGSFKKPIIPRRGSSPKAHKKAYELNLKNKIQLDFFFNDMAVLSAFGLLFGPNYARGLPKKSANKAHIPYFGKHSLFCFEKIIVPLMTTQKQLVLERLSGLAS